MNVFVEVALIALIWAFIGSLFWLCAAIHEIVLALQDIAEWFRGPKQVAMAGPLKIELVTPAARTTDSVVETPVSTNPKTPEKSL